MNGTPKPPAELTPFRGALDAAGIAAGMNAAIRNASRLFADAELLEANGRHASAIALAILSIEESGKIHILRRMAIAPDKSTLISDWKAYRRHKSKNPHWIVGELVASGARQLHQFRPAVEGGDHADVLDALKQIAFYSDCFGDKAHWSEPAEVTSAGLASSVIAQARIVLPVREVQEREIALWIEFVGPHYAKPTMAAAVVEWYVALKGEGLTDIDPDSMKRFMGSLVTAS